MCDGDLSNNCNLWFLYERCFTSRFKLVTDTIWFPDMLSLFLDTKVIKPGACPSLIRALFPLNECTTDSDCPGISKCCSIFFGKICLVPSGSYILMTRYY